MSKSRVSEELNYLRQQGLAKSGRGKFKDSAVFRSPEEAEIYLKQVQTSKNKQEKTIPPTNLNSSDLNDWYSKQRQFDLEERKKRTEAETLLREYRSKFDYDASSSPQKKNNGTNIVQGSIIVEEGIHRVSDQVEKLEQEVVLSSADEDVGRSRLVDVSDDNNEPEISASVEEKMITDEDEGISDVAEVEEDKYAEDENVEDQNTRQIDGDAVDVESNAESTDSNSAIEEIEEEEYGESDDKPMEDLANTEDSEEEALVVDEIKMDHVCLEEDSVDIEVMENAKDPDTSEEGWRFLISREPGMKFSPEANRYHLYVAYACPWAHRTTIVRNLKGLDEVIGVTHIHPTWQFTKPGIDDHRGWVFGSSGGEPLSNTAGIGSFPSNWGEEDPNMGAKTIRDIYEKANDETGKYILPVLWDKKLETIVSNESSEIIRMLNNEFNEFAENADLDLYPDNLRNEIDALGKWVYPNLNNGVYRCGLASTQTRYDDAIDELTFAFDKIDSILQKQRYLAGDTFTEADVRLFVTLIRFDEVYDVYFKCNTRSVAGTPAILNYVREIYQMKGVTESCQMDMIKAHYYTSHVELNKYSIIPRGDNFLGLLKQPHNRKTM